MAYQHLTPSKPTRFQVILIEIQFLGKFNSWLSWVPICSYPTTSETSHRTSTQGQTLGILVGSTFHMSLWISTGMKPGVFHSYEWFKPKAGQKITTDPQYETNKQQYHRWSTTIVWSDIGHLINRIEITSKSHDTTGAHLKNMLINSKPSSQLVETKQRLLKPPILDDINQIIDHHSWGWWLWHVITPSTSKHPEPFHQRCEPLIGGSKW